MGLPEKVALVAGAEGPGLQPATRARTHFDVRIPMHGGVDSLNLGHALAIAMAAVSPSLEPAAEAAEADVMADGAAEVDGSAEAAPATDA